MRGRPITAEMIQHAHENREKITEAGRKHGLSVSQMSTLKTASNISPLKAIKLWCMQCQGFSREECSLKGCPLWLYRKGNRSGEVDKAEWHKCFNRDWISFGMFPDTEDMVNLTYQQIVSEAGCSDDSSDDE